MTFTVVIPARYESSRLPGKPLADILGKPMIQHVVEQAQKSGAARVVVATDDQRVVDAVESFGAQALMTSADHQSGTERIAEVVELLHLTDDEIVVNVQGDEPLIPPEVIIQLAENLSSQALAKMATLAVPVTDSQEIFNPNAVKVTLDKNGYALYFSRAPIPFNRQHFVEGSANGQTPVLSQDVIQGYLRHIGIYAYKAGFIKWYAGLEESPLEKTESLEQLRVLWHGERIHVAQAIKNPPAGVDTPDDLERVRQQLSHV